MLIITFTAFFLMSGFVMISHLFKGPEPVVHESSFALSMTMGDDPEAFGKKLKKAYDLNGRMDKPKKLDDGRWNYMFYRPGIAQKVVVNAARDSVHITQTERLNFYRVVDRIHHLRGFHGGWKYVIWGILFDFAALSLIIFALTGILMWLKMRKLHRYGWWFLGTGFGLTIFILLSMYFLG